MKKNSFETILSIRWLVWGSSLVIIIIAINALLADDVRERVDLTKEKALHVPPHGHQGHSWKKLDTPVKIRYYYSAMVRMNPAPIRSRFSRLTPSMWRIYSMNTSRRAERHKKIIQWNNMTPESRILRRGRFRASGWHPRPDACATGEKIYLGLSVSMLDSKGGDSPVLDPGSANACWSMICPAPFRAW